MKKLILAVVAALLLPTGATAQVRVKGYVKKDGTYVAPHYRSRPNSTTLDNYSSKGNYNPYTGKVGTQNNYSKPYNSGYGSNPSTSYGSSTESDDSFDYDPR